METIDIQNRSFVVRWVKASRGDIINYQLKPLKKSIELGIYKRSKVSIDGNSNSAVHIAPDTKALLDYTTKSLLHRNSTTSMEEAGALHNQSASSTPLSHESRKSHGSLSLANIQQQSEEIPLRERLTASGFTMVKWIGYISGNKMQQGTLEVKEDDYYYAFILDNTSSKNVKKKVLFNAGVVNDDDNHSVGSSKYPLSPVPTPKGALALPEDDFLSVGQGRYLQGYLFKKRRKKLQGFKKRFFSLDYKYGTLSYYLNDHNQTCRGEIVINLSTVSANKKDKLIIIDSGMELWVLKGKDTISWKYWVDALQLCFEKPKLDISDKKKKENGRNKRDHNHHEQQELESETPNVEVEPSLFVVHHQETELVDSYFPLPDENYSQFTTNLKLIQQRVEKCRRDSLFYVSSDKDQKRQPGTFHTSSCSSMETNAKQKDDSTPRSESGDSLHSLLGLTNQPTSEHQLYKNLRDIETFLDQFVKQSETLLSDHKLLSKKNKDNLMATISGFSDNEEFFDAEDEISHGVILLDNDDTLEDTTLPHKLDSEILEMENEEEVETTNDYNETSSITTSSASTDLYPLPWKENVRRRNDIRPAATSPPSLLSFLRKNVGKDLSSVAMPVTSNEPISILQMIAETFEYADLLSKAIKTSDSSHLLAYVSAFAISCLSVHRDKTRALRKPFNPLLGETFELIRDDMGFRLIAEKVSHRPPIFAFHAEHADWECSYTVSPVQRFWGKSVELNNEGTIHLKLKAKGESFEWVQPTTMLKNLIAGERYVEPINEFEIMTSKGGSSTVAFKSAGMFGGRSEDLSVTIVPYNATTGSKKTLTGKWTDSLKDKDTQEIFWEAGRLVSDSKKKYGFTEFTANLNEITQLERDMLPPTDSRLRPDIRAYENGDVEQAESLKLTLEQTQRDRRINGNDIKPKYFEKVSNNKWKIIRGHDGYWERRKRHDWADVKPLW